MPTGPDAGDQGSGPGQGLPDLPPPAVQRSNRFAPSLVWIVPVVAAIAALSLTLRTYLTIGPSITVSLQTAEGLEAGKTQVRYKEVVIGHVTGIVLSDDHEHVLVHIRLDQRDKDFAVADTRFWVVRPRLGLAGVSGLGTLISGAYVAADLGTAKDRKTDFTGLETPPAVLRGQKGRSFVVHGDDLGSLDIGSPVYYRRIQAGRISGYKLDADGKGVSIQLFVDAPYDRFVTAEAHFWNASGIDLSVSAVGLKLNTESLATVLAGGVAFQSFDESKTLPPADEGTRFEMYRDVAAAMKLPDGPELDVRMHFNETLRGLVVGAPVDFRGITIGNVKSINLDYEPETQTFPADIIATIYPQRLGRINERFFEAGQGRVNFIGVLSSLIDHGFRAQVRTGNLLTQQLYIAIDVVPNAKPARLDASKLPIEIPTAPGSFDALQKQLTNIVAKLDKVPFEEIGNELRDALHSARLLLAKLDNEIAPQARAMLEQAQNSLKSLDRSLAEDSPLQRGAGHTLDELARAAQSLRALADYLNRHPEALIRGKRGDAAPQSPQSQEQPRPPSKPPGGP
jgi:paraquat-inducible protein B